MARSRRFGNEGGWRSVDDGLRPETDSSEAYQEGAGGQEVAEEDFAEQDVDKQGVAKQDVGKGEQGGAASRDLVLDAARGARSASARPMERVRA